MLGQDYVAKQREISPLSHLFLVLLEAPVKIKEKKLNFVSICIMFACLGFFSHPKDHKAHECKCPLSIRGYHHLLKFSCLGPSSDVLKLLHYASPPMNIPN